MTTILHIDSSISGSESVSAELGQTLVDGIKASDTHVQYRNVSSENIPHFNAGTIAALSEGKAELADTYIKEVQEADIVVIGAPMYNFGIPTQLKSWFDHIARAGTTFKYTDTGPVGLLTGKKVYVITTSGGEHRNTPRDGVEPWLQTFSNPRVERFDPFLMLDDFGSDNADDYIAGFPPHPHRGFETITYMLKGKMEHRDHLGNVGLLSDGGVQWMTAGRGVIHSEMPKQTEGELHGFRCNRCNRCSG